MKIAVPSKENNQIDAHFGHCAFYKIYTVSENNAIISEERLDSPQGCGCKSDIAATFEKTGVKIMLAGGIGDGAINKLRAHGVDVIRNCAGDARQIAEDYLAGKITDGGSNCTAHEHGHTCSHN